MSTARRHYVDPRTTTHDLVRRAQELALRHMLSELPSRTKQELIDGGNSADGLLALTAAEHLEHLQLERWIELRMRQSRQCRVRRAREAGATWCQIAEVLGTDVLQARAAFAAWIDGQQQLHDDFGVGLTDDEAAAAWMLLEDGVT